MSLFDKFDKTIFLKEDSDLIKQLDELKSIRDRVDNKDEIDKDIKLLEYGIQGEKDIAYELKNANIGMYVLHDITLEFEGNKAQIDYMIFTRGYTYLIECKNLYGNITVDNNGQFIREYDYKGRKIKESIYSPYTQIIRHNDIMKKIWASGKNKLVRALFHNSFNDSWYKPLVVLSNPKAFLNIKHAPSEMRNNIIRVDQLVSYIKKDLDNYSKFDLSNESEVKSNAEGWLSSNVVEYNSIANKYKKHIDDSKDNLYEELRAFRKEKSKRMNIPAYYIFNDEEMEKIIKSRPKDLKELKSLNILSDVKLKLHGEDIIKIINK